MHGVLAEGSMQNPHISELRLDDEIACAEGVAPGPVQQALDRTVPVLCAQTVFVPQECGQSLHYWLVLWVHVSPQLRLAKHHLNLQMMIARDSKDLDMDLSPPIRHQLRVD